MRWFYKLSFKQVFLLDAIGALVSAVILLVVVANLQYVFGLSYYTIYLLAAIAGVYFVYSISCYLLLHKNHVAFLKAISVLNLLYSALILVLLYQHYQQLTSIGIYYMIGDATLVFSIAAMEYKRATTFL